MNNFLLSPDTLVKASSAKKLNRKLQNAIRFLFASELAKDFNLSLGEALSLVSKYGDDARQMAEEQTGKARFHIYDTDGSYRFV